MSEIKSELKATLLHATKDAMRARDKERVKESPQHGSILNVIGRDITSNAILTTSITNNDFSINDSWGTSDGVGFRFING